ncbi:MAG: hypothetical protein AUG51_13630 [Acidobacteria bacterium 13_1_20CM_3_53_8]|nr:MAG: hypothetical protein AUG51_13630 [Acidobacteria bacterium 13_1_20CM_3_53_8]
MAETSEPETIQSSAISSAEPTDVELVERVREGYEDAFEELFNRHRRRVALIASRFFRQREQIEEIVQESFAKAFFALGDFTNQKEQSFAAWLARIAFNASYDELRRQKRRHESSLSEVTAEEAEWLQERLSSGEKDVESAAIARELAGKLMAKLSPEDRFVLVMLDVEGLSVAEIAGLTKWSAAKVKVRAHRARQRLRGLLKRLM